MSRPIADLETVFWRHVVPTEDGCWIYQGALTQSGTGYGHLRIGGRNGRDVLAHRASFEIHVGPVPDGLCVLHRCDVKQCVRPDHLYLGTQRDNMVDVLERQLRTSLKLSSDTVRQIRTSRAAGASVASLASHFSVSEQAIRDVIARRRWAHVA